MLIQHHYHTTLSRQLSFLPNEDVVIAQTAKAILDLNYPHDRGIALCLQIIVQITLMKSV